MIRSISTLLVHTSATWLLVFTASVSGCGLDIDDRAGFTIHPELQLTDWKFTESQETLRAEIEIPGVMAPSPLQVDLEEMVVRGSLSVPNRDLGEQTAILSYYAGLNNDTEEVILGQAVSTITITKDSISQIKFPILEYQADDYRFDPNRNNRNSIQDLVNGTDPAPLPNPITLSPKTLSFESGITPGGFTRAFFIVTNTSSETMDVALETQLSAGISLATLDTVFEVGGPIPTSQTTLRMEPGDEQVMAVTFAPTDAQFLAEATSVTALGQSSNTQYGSLFRLLGNPDGQIPEPPSDYQNQTLSLVKPEGDYSGITVPYSRSYLFSRSPWEVTAFDERDVGAVGGQDIDQAYTVIVPAGHRFSLALDGITNDIDLFIYELETNDGTNFSFVDSDNNSTMV